VGGGVTGVTGGVTGARVGGATVGGTVGGTGARVGGGVVMVPGPMVACAAHGDTKEQKWPSIIAWDGRLICQKKEAEAHRDCGLHRRGHGGGHSGPDGRGHCRGRDRRDGGVSARRDRRLYHTQENRHR
jgi:hypothetical protein